MDKELLSAIGQMMDEKLSPMQQDIAELKQDIAEVKHEVVKTNIRIEHEIIKRLDALMDGYILNHEEIADLERRVDDIEMRVG